MNLNELKELLQLLEDKDITEFELEEGGMKLRVRKASATASAAPGASPPAAAAPAPASSGPALASPVRSAAPEPAAAAEAAAPDDGLVVVKSPIVGTFFRSPDPNAAPFIEVGDHVRTGQVLCIVEAMKLMNEIEAESGGTVVKVHAENGQPVQYGDPLFSLRPD